jgi:hypothetical protein
MKNHDGESEHAGAPLGSFDRSQVLAALASPSASVRADARATLHDAFVTEEPVPELPAVAKALAAVALDPSIGEVEANVRLLVDLVLVDPDAYLFEAFGGAAAVRAMSSLEREAYDVLVDLAPALERSLHDPNPRLRAVACLALSFVVEPFPTSTLEALASGDPAEEVRVSALFALARHARGGSATTRARVAERIAEVGGAPAAIATYLLGALLDRGAIEALATSLHVPARSHDDLPWAHGDLADVAAGILRVEGERARFVVDAVVAAVEQARDRAQLRNAELALFLLLPEHANARRLLTAADLSDAQRAALERMGRAQAPADYRRYGLPEAPAQLLALLSARGGAEGPPIERGLVIPGKGERPTWQWFDALFNKEIERDPLLLALRERFTPSELLEVLRDATRGAFGAPLPPMALVFEAAAALGDDRDAFVRLADETLASGPTAAPPAALLAALPLVRLGLTTERYDPLFLRVFRGNDKAVVAEFERLLPSEVVARVKPKSKASR